MKSKFAIAVLLTAICVSFVVAGVAGARQSNPADAYTVYLPIVRSFCTPKVTAYASASSPVVRVGEIITLTGAIVNECSRLVGLPSFSAYPDPVGILSPTVPGVVGYYSVPIGEYRELTLTLQAVGPGSVTVTAGMIYETVNDEILSHFYWDHVVAQPVVVRVFPNP